MSSGGAQQPANAPVSMPGWRVFAAVFLVLATLGIALNLIVVPRTFSATAADGLVYVDAFDRALTGNPTVRGDIIGPTALQEVLCGDPRNTVSPGAQDWDCEDPDPADVQLQTTAWVHPPTYFLVEATVARAVHLVAPQVSVFMIGRMLGAVWFAIGGLLLVILGALWGARPWPATAAVAAFLPTPLFTSNFSYVTPDNAVLIAGAVVPICVTQWWRGSWPAWTLAPAGLLAGGLIKQTFLPAVIAGALLVGFLWLQARRTGDDGRTSGQSVLALAWLLGSAAIASIGWQLIKSTWGVDLPARTGPDPFTLAPDPSSAVALLFQGTWLIPGGDTNAFALEPLAMVGISALLTLITAGASFGLLLYGGWSDRLFAVALAGVIGIGVSGLVIGMSGSLTAGNWLPPSPRYVMAAFPLYAVPLLVIARVRWVWVVMIAVTAVGFWSWTTDLL